MSDCGCVAVSLASAGTPTPTAARTRRGRRRALRAPRARLRAPGVPEQDRSRAAASDADVRAAARADAGVLRLLRLALVGARTLAARAAGAARFPTRPSRRGARAALAQSLTPANIAAEVAYLRGRVARRSSGRTGSRGCCSSRRSCARGTTRRRGSGRARSQPLEREAAQRLEDWLPKLHYPIRIGEHDQTAFSFGLSWTGRASRAMRRWQRCSSSRARASTATDRDCPLAYEPSGEDFLSPCLAEADFMRRVLPPRGVRDVAARLPAADPDERPGRLARARRRDRSQPTRSSRTSTA